MKLRISSCSSRLYYCLEIINSLFNFLVLWWYGGPPLFSRLLLSCRLLPCIAMHFQSLICEKKMSHYRMLLLCINCFNSWMLLLFWRCSWAKVMPVKVLCKCHCWPLCSTQVIQMNAVSSHAVDPATMLLLLFQLTYMYCNFRVLAGYNNLVNVRHGLL